MCGITFAEFRKGGRLGCPYDYVAFEEDLEPLLVNIHGATSHSGKVPKNLNGSPERQFRLKQLKDEMREAITKEQYEVAGKLRDKIAAIENGQNEIGQNENGQSDESNEEAPNDGPPDDDFQSFS